MNLVSLSITTGKEAQSSPKRLPALRDTITWYPEIPEADLSFLQIQGPHKYELWTESTVSWAMFGGEEGLELQHVRSISSWSDPRGCLLGVEFLVGPERSSARLCVTGFELGKRTDFALDRALGEHVTSLGKLPMENRGCKGFQVLSSLALSFFKYQADGLTRNCAGSY